MAPARRLCRAIIAAAAPAHEIGRLLARSWAMASADADKPVSDAAIILLGRQDFKIPLRRFIFVDCSPQRHDIIAFIICHARANIISSPPRRRRTPRRFAGCDGPHVVLPLSPLLTLMGALQGHDFSSHGPFS